MENRLAQLADQTRQHLEKLTTFGFDVMPAKQSTSTEIASGASRPRNDDSEFAKLRVEVLACTRCSELTRTRHTVVFGSGNPNADLVFVGEAPGYYEDQQGLPFVGKAGELLTRMIEAMGLKRSDVFICNVLKCRPPNNRNPAPEEIINCRPYLERQLALIKPKAICAMGNFAAQTLLKSTRSITQLRGETFDLNGIPCVPTFHPAYLLRNPADKKKAWEDLKRVREILGMKPIK